ncbi:Glyoxylase, beta-lactamase superfamily II [Leifsonia sp. 21MFCrub1.1]|nr:Glyoxylase, beta-lactamase superfamily II [Leifsonia sp. 21MFCrub1.1]
MDAISDGAFVARPSYFGDHVSGTERPDVFDRDGAAWLPIGCFLIRQEQTGTDAPAPVVLVDAGLGPALDPMPDGMMLVGGQLLTGLHAAGVAPAEITDVVITHFHLDHVGWLFGRDARPIFPNARVWFGAAEWAHFVNGPGEMAPHIEAGFRAAEGTPALRPVETDVVVAPGVRAVPAPGHTPGHLAVVAESGGERLLLLGDSITIPQQMAEDGWRSMGDVDAAIAERTRQALWAQLAEPGTTGVGAHFPELRSGRVVAGEWSAEWSADGSPVG